MIKYLGSKRLLVDRIVRAAVRARGGRVGTVLDLFSGTSRVGHAFKRAGWRVIANDSAQYAHVLARCYVGADRERVEPEASRLIAELNRLPGMPGGGFFTRTYCDRARYVQPFNGERIDAIRAWIGARGLETSLEAVLLTSLLEAADRVDSTTGVQMAYLKSWSRRSYNALELRMPEVLPGVELGPCEAHRLDALEAAQRFDADVAYLDPPYNQHAYLGNYHVWETLCAGDEPEVFGVACKRVDIRQRRSRFNHRRHSQHALEEVIQAVRAPVVIASLSDEGFVSVDDLARMLSGLFAGRAMVLREAVGFKRYIGATIGVYNPLGQRVGTPGHKHTREHLLIAVDPQRVELPPDWASETDARSAQPVG